MRSTPLFVTGYGITTAGNAGGMMPLPVVVNPAVQLSVTFRPAEPSGSFVVSVN